MDTMFPYLSWCGLNNSLMQFCYVACDMRVSVRVPETWIEIEFEFQEQARDRDA